MFYSYFILILDRIVEINFLNKLFNIFEGNIGNWCNIGVCFK